MGPEPTGLSQHIHMGQGLGVPRPSPPSGSIARPPPCGVVWGGGVVGERKANLASDLVTPLQGKLQFSLQDERHVG